ncbi:hypothetical protein PanWU01x14_318780, partial [Parasponia andersonii]
TPYPILARVLFTTSPPNPKSQTLFSTIPDSSVSHTRSSSASSTIPNSLSLSQLYILSSLALSLSLLGLCPPPLCHAQLQAHETVTFSLISTVFLISRSHPPFSTKP